MPKAKEKEKTQTTKPAGSPVKNTRALIGKAGLEFKKKLDRVSALRREKSASRLYLKSGSSAKVVFLDDVGYYDHIHEVWSGKRKHFLTCSRGETGSCILCNKGLRPTFTAHYTVIDTREFARDDGTVSKNRKVIFPAKGEAINILADLIERSRGLAGKVVTVNRYGDKSPNCGNAFVLEGKADLKKVFGKDMDLAPFNYEKILALPTVEEIEAALSNSEASSEDPASDGAPDDNLLSSL